MIDILRKHYRNDPRSLKKDINDLAHQLTAVKSDKDILKVAKDLKILLQIRIEMKNNII